MPVFSYEAVGEDGKKIRGIIDAESYRAAVHRLKLKKQIPLRITEETFAEVRSPSASGSGRFLRRVSSRELMVMTRQLGILLRAGLSVTGGLTALIAQMKNPYLKGVLTNVRERLSEGSSLHEALAGYPRIFPRLYVESVAAGEESGRLSEVLLGLAEYLNRRIALRNRLFSSLAYPVVMGIVALGVFFILMIYVLPSVAEIFTAIHQPLPATTRLLLGIGAWMRAYGEVIPVGVIFVGFALFRLRKSERGKELMDAALLKVPMVNTWVTKSQVARLARTLAAVLASGIPLLRALRLARGIITNKVLRISFDDVIRQIGEGLPLGKALERLSWMPPVVVQMVSVGEESGGLEEMLLHVAEMYEEETEAAMKTVLSVLEPFMILFMGGIVGWIVISVLLPIFNMNQLVG